MGEPVNVHDELRTGRIVAVGGKLWQRCFDCGQIIRIDKPILGSLHLCLTDEERAARHGSK